MHTGCPHALILLCLLILWPHTQSIVTARARSCSNSYRTMLLSKRMKDDVGRGKGRGKDKKPKGDLVQRIKKAESGNFLSKLAAGFGAILISAAAIWGSNSAGTHQQTDIDMVFRTASDVPQLYLKERRTIMGQVIKVVDGDTVRIRHLPSASSSAEWGAGKLSDETIMVRIAAVDSPETAKFGQEGQPFGDEAKAFTQNALLGKKVRVRVLAKDRYARLLGLVRYDALPEKDISEELLKRGYAVVYRQGGAVYDDRKGDFEKLEAAAKSAKKGLWGQDGGGEAPADYKKRMNVKKDGGSKSKSKSKSKSARNKERQFATAY